MLREGKRLTRLADAKLGELVAAIKQQEAEHPTASSPNGHVRRLANELHGINAQLGRIAEQLREAIGISETELQAIEEHGLPTYDNRWWHHEIIETPPSEYFEEFTPTAIDTLLKEMDGAWLKAQARRPYRLGETFLRSPLHLVGGIRVPPVDAPDPPQRFARMLLVALDHLNRRDDLDFFSAASFVPELTVLGIRLPLLQELGPEAVRKFVELPTATPEDVHSIIYELLVGTACVLKGLRVEMLAASTVGKSPDLRLHGFRVPAVIECKRRHGLTRYELDEARLVEGLYMGLRPSLEQSGLHGSLEVRFNVPVRTIDPKEFANLITNVLNQDSDLDTISTRWGEFGYRRLPFSGNVSDTRLYSPDYLENVFMWSGDQKEWDGILCRVEPPPQIRVRNYRLPFCIKWRSDCTEALTKKSRGVTSLWGRAAKQIPAGEVGFIYIAYQEGQRSELADARTRHIAASCTEWWHRWSVHIPIIVISRLYARALGVGVPDLIESSLPGSSPGEEHWLARLPSRVFAVRPDPG